MNMLRLAVEAHTKHALELYELSGGVAHDAEKGAFREFFLSGLLRPLLPDHFAVGSGVVVDGEERQGAQTDIIVYDKRLLPPILLAGERGLFPIDSVLAVVEVKSTLRAGDYDQVVAASRRLSPNSVANPDGMRIMTPGRGTDQTTLYPLCALFAYRSDAAMDEVERLEARCPEGHDLVRLICVVDKGVWVRSEQRERHVSADPLQNSRIFLLQLLNRLEETARSRGDYRLQDWL